MTSLASVVLSAGLMISQPGPPPAPPAPPAPPSPPAPAEPPTAPETRKLSTITVSVVRDGKETTITRSNDGITVMYPGKDGERIEVHAADEAELRRNPEAYELYRKYLGSENPRVRVFGELGRDAWRMPSVPGIGPRLRMEFDREWAEGLRRQLDESMRNTERARARAMEQAERARERLEQLRERSAQQPFSAEPGNPARQLGLQIDRADTALRSQLGDGVLITRVVPNSRAQAMGLQTWDYIKKFGDTEVSEPDQLRELIRAAEGPVTLEVLRGGKPLTLTEPTPGR